MNPNECDCGATANCFIIRLEGEAAYCYGCIAQDKSKHWILIDNED